MCVTSAACIQLSIHPWDGVKHRFNLTNYCDKLMKIQYNKDVPNKDMISVTVSDVTEDAVLVL